MALSQDIAQQLAEAYGSGDIGAVNTLLGSGISAQDVQSYFNFDDNAMSGLGALGIQFGSPQTYSSTDEQGNPIYDYVAPSTSVGGLSAVTSGKNTVLEDTSNNYYGDYDSNTNTGALTPVTPVPVTPVPVTPVPVTPTPVTPTPVTSTDTTTATFGGKNYTLNNADVNSVYNQIVGQGNLSKWTGEGFGSADANARAMAQNLVASGITNINQIGQKIVTTPGYYTSTEQGDTWNPETKQTVLINKATGQPLINDYGERGGVGNAFSGTYTGKGNTSYNVGFDAQGKPILYTSGASSATDLSDLQMLLSLGSFIPGVAPFAQGLNAAISAGQGNYTGALLGALGAAGSAGFTDVMGIPISDAKSIVGGLNALQTGNVAGLVNSVAGYAGASLPTELRTGLTLLNAATAFANNDYAGMADAAGSLTGSSDAKLAASALRLTEAFNRFTQTGDISGLANAASAFNNTAKTASASNAAFTAFKDVITAGGTPEDALAASNQITGTNTNTNTTTTGGTTIDATTGQTIAQATSDDINDVAVVPDTWNMVAGAGLPELPKANPGQIVMDASGRPVSIGAYDFNTKQNVTVPLVYNAATGQMTYTVGGEKVNVSPAMYQNAATSSKNMDVRAAWEKWANNPANIDFINASKPTGLPGATSVTTVNTTATDVTGKTGTTSSTANAGNIIRGGGYSEYANTYGTQYATQNFVKDLQAELAKTPNDANLNAEYTRLTGTEYNPSYSNEGKNYQNANAAATINTNKAGTVAALTSVLNSGLLSSNDAPNIEALLGLLNSGRTGDDMGGDYSSVSADQLSQFNFNFNDKGGIDIGDYILNLDGTIEADPTGILQPVPVTPTPTPVTPTPTPTPVTPTPTPVTPTPTPTPVTPTPTPTPVTPTPTPTPVTPTPTPTPVTPTPTPTPVTPTPTPTPVTPTPTPTPVTPTPTPTPVTPTPTPTPVTPTPTPTPVTPTPTPTPVTPTPVTPTPTPVTPTPVTPTPVTPTTGFGGGYTPTPSLAADTKLSYQKVSEDAPILNPLLFSLAGVAIPQSTPEKTLTTQEEKDKKEEDKKEDEAPALDLLSFFSFAEGGMVPQHPMGQPEFYSEGGAGTTYIQGQGDGTSDQIPAMVANSEFVLPADVVSALGNGSSDSGADILDQFIRTIREHKHSNPSDELPPESKGPLEYLSSVHMKGRRK